MYYMHVVYVLKLYYSMYIMFTLLYVHCTATSLRQVYQAKQLQET